MAPDNVGSPDGSYDEFMDHVRSLIDEFAKSPHAEDLPQDQREEVSFVIQNVAELLAEFEGTSLEDCDSAALESVYTEHYPLILGPEPDEFSAVAPVLASFCRFLATREYNPNGEELSAHVAELGEDSDDILGDVLSPSNTPPEPTSNRQAADPTLEEIEAVDDILDSLSPASRDVLQTVTQTTEEIDGPVNPSTILAAVDVTADEYRAAMDEVRALLQANDATSVPGVDADSTILGKDRSERFLELYGRLMRFINDQDDIVPDVETYEDFKHASLAKIGPIRDRLYHKDDTDALITEFVSKNPTGLSESDLARVQAWTAYEVGEFAVVEHRGGDTIFLDMEEPRAFAVAGVQGPMSKLFRPSDLPMLVRDAVLLPFDELIVTDGWFTTEPVDTADRSGLGKDVLEERYENAKRIHGVTEKLPPSPRD